VATRYENRQSLVRIEAEGAQLGRMTALTDGYGGDLDPTVSAAGGRMAFSSTRVGNRHLWTADPDGTILRPLTSGTVQDDRPALSPDAQTVAFVSDRGGRVGIWLIAAAGGTPRKLVDAVPISSLSWSRDGASIIYAAGAGAWPGLWRVSVTSGPSFVGLAFLTPDGTAQNAMTPKAPGISSGFVNGMLAWSPDGRRLVVTAQNTNLPTSVWLAELGKPGAAVTMRKLVELPVGPRIRGLTWTDDGAAVIVGQHDAIGDIVLLDQQP
jgi:TolB protein